MSESSLHPQRHSTSIRSFDRLLAGCPILVSIETDNPRTVIVVGMEELEAVIVDIWPSASRHQKSASEFGSDFFGLRDPDRWAWSADGRPQRHVLVHNDVAIGIYPLPTSQPASSAMGAWMRDHLDRVGSATAFATWAMSRDGSREIVAESTRHAFCNKESE